MKTIGIGVIGWGFMGRTHTYALRNLPLFYPEADFKVALRCVCARHIENARQAALAIGFERYTDDFRELINSPDIDVVSICTPNDQHEVMAIATLKAGKHVYIDKPLAVNGESAQRIAAVAHTSPGSSRMVFNNRYFPATIRAKELVAKIGDILSFQARYLHSGSIDPMRPAGWKLRSQGGVLLDLGSHALDLVTWLIGYPTRVFCKTHTLYRRRPLPDGSMASDITEDHALAILELPNGAIGTMEASKIATGSDDELSIEIRGTKGALRWNLMDGWRSDSVPAMPRGDRWGVFTQLKNQKGRVKVWLMYTN